MTIAEIVVVWDSIQPSAEVSKTLIPKILRAVSIYPNANVSAFDIDMSIRSAYRLPEVGKISWTVEFFAGNSVKLILKVRISEAGKEEFVTKGMLKTGKTTEFPILYQNDKSMFKINLAGNLGTNPDHQYLVG